MPGLPGMPGELVADRQAKEVDHFIDVRPDEMGAQDGCGARLKPKTRNSCMFCSYGDVPCPPIPESRTSAVGPSVS